MLECGDNAPKLQGKLLLIVGEVDDNVDPASTMQVVNALDCCQKRFRIGRTSGNEIIRLAVIMANKKRRDFFVKTFYNQPTPDWNKK